MTDTAKPAFRNAKFEATGETKIWLGITLHRIRAVADIAAIGIAAGTLGGTPLGEETFAILDLLEKQAAIHGFNEPISVEAGAAA